MSRLLVTSLLSKRFRRTATQKAILVTFASLCWMLPAFASDKTISVEPQTSMDPAMINRVTLGGAEVQCGLFLRGSGMQPVTPVAASDDWLQNMTISLRNRTDKIIVYGTITLDFPETGTGRSDSPMRAYVIAFGRIPDSGAYNGRTGQPIVQGPDVKPILLAPKKTMVINLADYIEGIKQTIDPKAISRVIIRRSSFFFDDGMRWAGRLFSTPDPVYHGQWIYIRDPSYFPGRPDFWPPRAPK